MLEWELSRVVVTITQFPLTVLFIGYTTFWNGIWILGSVSYVAAFACFGPVALRQGKGAELQEATLQSCHPFEAQGSLGMGSRAMAYIANC